jgi:hypothetical protein
MEGTLHRHAAWNLDQADAILFGPGDLRNDGGSVADAGDGGYEAVAPLRNRK